MATAERLDTMPKPVKTIEKGLLNLARVKHLEVPGLIAMKINNLQCELVVPRNFDSLSGVSHSLVEYVSYYLVISITTLYH